jgi:hypothetical protein
VQRSELRPVPPGGRLRGRSWRPNWSVLPTPNPSAAGDGGVNLDGSRAAWRLRPLGAPLADRVPGAGSGGPGPRQPWPPTAPRSRSRRGSPGRGAGQHVRRLQPPAPHRDAREHHGIVLSRPTVHRILTAAGVASVRQRRPTQWRDRRGATWARPAALSWAASSQPRGGSRERSYGDRKCAMSASRAFLNTHGARAVASFLPSWMSRVRVSSPAVLNRLRTRREYATSVAGAPSEGARMRLVCVGVLGQKRDLVGVEESRSK